MLRQFYENGCIPQMVSVMFRLMGEWGKSIQILICTDYLQQHQCDRLLTASHLPPRYR